MLKGVGSGGLTGGIGVFRFEEGGIEDMHLSPRSQMQECGIYDPPQRGKVLDRTGKYDYVERKII